MAEAIGADTVDMDQIQLHPTVYQETGMLVSESVRSMGGILVNAEGKRFCNDMSTRDAVSNAELEQPGAYAYIIFDQRIVDDLKSCQKYISNGLTVSSDSYEGLAKEMGLTGDAAANFVETMNTWNASAAMPCATSWCSAASPAATLPPTLPSNPTLLSSSFFFFG